MGYGSVAIKTYTEILGNLRDIVVTRTELTDLLPADALAQLLSATARQQEALYFQVAKLLDIFNVEKAKGDDLSVRLHDYDTDREAGQLAPSSGHFIRTTTVGDLTIPAGTIVASAKAQYVSLIDATIANGATQSGDVGVISTKTGTDQSAPIGAISTVVTAFGQAEATGLSFYNVVAAVGRAEESDSAARKRVRAQIRKLNRTAPDSLPALALDEASVEATGERVVTYRLVEDAINPGVVILYIDNGTGTTEVLSTIGDGNPGTGEMLVDNATGGEDSFLVAQPPIYRDPLNGWAPVLTLFRNGVALVATDYHVITGTGFILLDAAAFPTGLGVGDSLEAQYTYYGGLIQQVQWVLQGRGADPTRYKGGLASGARLHVRAPTIVSPLIAVTVSVAAGYDGPTVRAAVRDAIIAYINGLGVGNDIILAEIVSAAMAVDGVLDCVVTTPVPADPPNNIPIADSQLARVSEPDVQVT